MPENFNHSQLSAARLHQVGIRSTSEIEDSYFDPNRRSFILRIDTYPILLWIGFTTTSKPIKIAYTSIDGEIVTLDAMIPSREEIANEYCKYCR